MNSKRGYLIALEGIDGSGKSTQSMLLAKKLQQQGYDCYTTMEPTNSPIGSVIRQIISHRLKTDDRVIAPLFVADRLDHLLNDVDGILHKINSGTIVITDRYYFSSFAYQGLALPVEDIIQLNTLPRKLLKPDITVFLDINPDIAITRICNRNQNAELFEKLEVLKECRSNYLKSFDILSEEENIIKISAEGNSDYISRCIYEHIEILLNL